MYVCVYMYIHVWYVHMYAGHVHMCIVTDILKPTITTYSTNDRDGA